MNASEIISAIKRSMVPTLCVEGTQDKAALRLLEDQIGLKGVVLPCHGRSNLLEVWAHRSEFTHKKVAFMADRDLFVFSGIPSNCVGIIFTNGYSLENDILESKRWKKLFDFNDIQTYEMTLDLAIKYYWSECNKYFNLNQCPCWVSSFKLVDDHKKGCFPTIAGFNNCKVDVLGLLNIKNTLTPYK
jgi:hypothetical protein